MLYSWAYSRFLILSLLIVDRLIASSVVGLRVLRTQEVHIRPLDRLDFQFWPSINSTLQILQSIRKSKGLPGFNPFGFKEALEVPVKVRKQLSQGHSLRFRFESNLTTFDPTSLPILILATLLPDP